MARSWKLAAWMVVWLGVAWPLRAQTPPPPLPIASSGGGPVAFPIAQPMPPMGGGAGPMGPWKGPMPGGPGMPPGRGMPGSPGMPPGLMPGGPPGAPGGEGDALDLDLRAIKTNAFSNTDGGDYRPITHQVNLEYLIMWYKSHHHPILVTTGSDLDTIPGAIGQPNTVVLHSAHTGAGASNAFRITYTSWLVDPEVLSLDASFMIMEQRSLVFNAASDDLGNPVLSRPFFNPNANAEDADPRALPFVMRGSVRDVFMTRMMGAEANFKYNVTGRPCDEGLALMLFTGPRWIRLDEKYQGFDFSQDLPAGSGESRTFNDDITCYNEFIGGQVGGTFRIRWDRLCLDLGGKLAIGTNFQTIKASGSTVIQDDQLGVISSNNEGLYVQSTNAGVRHLQHFSVVPEVNFNLGILVTDNFKFSVGCGGFNMSNVIRPGNLMDRRVDAQAVGIPTTLPSRQPAQTDFWSTWVNFGFEFLF